MVKIGSHHHRALLSLPIHTPPPLYLVVYWSPPDASTSPSASSTSSSASSSVKKPLLLDVHVKRNYPKNCPVLLYIHGGNWSSGDKSVLPPFIQYMVLKNWVIVSMNHHSTLQCPYPEQLVDVKRCIKWIRENIDKFGGKPESIFVAGAESGGHLASMAALTANDPFYQPLFEKIDTSLKACVVISACHDVTGYKQKNTLFEEWFTNNVLGRRNGREENLDFLKMSSPIMLVKTLEEARRRSNSATHSNAGSPLVKPDTSVNNNVESGPRTFLREEDLPPFFIVQ